MYRVLLIDDQAVFCYVAREMLMAAGGFEVVGEGQDGLEAAHLYQILRPDLLLMDVQMPVMNGFEAARRTLKAVPDAFIVLTSMHSNPEYARLSAEAGAAMFVSKRNLDFQLIRALLVSRKAGGAGQKAA